MEFEIKVRASMIVKYSEVNNEDEGGKLLLYYYIGNPAERERLIRQYIS